MTRRFFNLSLFWQLLSPMIIVVGLGLLSTVIALLGNDKTEQLWHGLYTENIQLVFKFAQLDKLYAAHQLTVFKHLNSNNKDEMEYYKDRLAIMEAHIGGELEQFSRYYENTSFDYFESEILFQELLRNTENYLDITTDIIWHSEDFEKNTALSLIESQMRPLGHSISDTSKAILDAENHKMREVYKKSTSLLESNSSWFIIIATSTVPLSILIVFILSKMNVQRIQEVVHCVESLGQGNLQARVNIRSEDELARLGNGLNDMACRLNHLIAELEHRRKDLEESEERYALAIQGANDGLWDWNLETNKVYFSPRWKDMLGYSKNEIADHIFDWQRHIHKNDFERTRGDLREHLEGNTSIFENEHRLRHRDGSYRWVLVRGVAIRNTENKPHRIAGSFTDITKRKQAEDALFREKELAQVTLASIGDAVITTDATGCTTYLNPEAQKLTGHGIIDACGKRLLEVFNVIDETTRRSLDNPIREVLDKGETISLHDNTVLIGGKNKEFAIEYSAAPIRDRDEMIIGAVLVFRDVSQSRAMAQQILWQASHDPLTGLVNRRQFEHRLEEALTNAKRYHEKHAVCYLDLDQFKVVNDTCGHVAGDELLRQIASLLQDRVRESDTLARLGGDEFGVILNFCSIDQAVIIANELRELIQDFRFVWEHKLFGIGVSIGLVSITEQTENLMTILRAADSACYAAKDQGRNRIHVYQENDMHLAQREGEMQWAVRIHEALDEKRFRLYCQPIVPLANTDDKGTHIEILLRLLDKKGNIIPPGAFISAAERYDLMTTIDRWVVKETFKNFKRCDTKLAAGKLQTCAINLSGRSISDKNFLKGIRKLLRRYRVPAERICFEITETAAIANLSNAIQFIKDLKKIGCRFALDDFGSGLSSFAYLKNLPVDYLKIDGTFVKDLVNDPIDQAMVQSINRIGHVLGLMTIAEFVESQAIAKRLTAMGVDYAQGYGIAKPIPIEDMMAKLRQTAA